MGRLVSLGAYKFLIGVRKDRVISKAKTHQMFKEQLGWHVWNGLLTNSRTR